MSPIPEVPPTGFVDPHGLATLIDQLGFQARRAGKVPLTVAAALLAEGEVVEMLVKGRFLGRDGVCLLTDRRLLVVNENEWKPDVVDVALTPALTVQGWADERSAALVLNTADGQVVIERISEREAAQALAGRIRERLTG